MSISESLTTVRELCNGKEWFNDVVPGDHNRIIVCVNHMDNETHTLIPDFIDNHQVLVHYASFYRIERDNFTENLSKTHTNVAPIMMATKPEFVDDVEAPDLDILIQELEALEKICGSNILQDIFYEVHDGKNAVTNLSSKFPEVRSSLENLFDVFGFDVIYEELDG